MGRYQLMTGTRKPTRHYGHMAEMGIIMVIMAVIMGFAMGVIGSLKYLNRIGYESPWKPLVVAKDGVLFALASGLSLLALFAAMLAIGFIWEWVQTNLGKLQSGGDDRLLIFEIERKVRNPGLLGIVIHFGFLGYSIPMCLWGGVAMIAIFPTTKNSCLPLEAILILLTLLCPILGVVMGFLPWLSARLSASKSVEEWSYSDPYILTFFALWPVGLWVSDASRTLLPWLSSALTSLAMLGVFIILHRLKRLRYRGRQTLGFGHDSSAP